jgi:hypothetical protein
MKRLVKISALLLLIVSYAIADEGLWLFNAVPKDKIKSRYGFVVTDAWLDHLRLGSVRFNNGGSGSFVSPNGLAFTNHHIAIDCMAKLADSNHDYLKTGFYAKTAAEEGKCPDLELNVLVGIEDVTRQINDSVKPEMSTAEAGAAQRAAMSTVEADCAKSGLRCDVVVLYSGGLYHLYKYKRYTDVRLVFAPEYAIAQFGGDFDNFEYPRHALDIGFFRVYENDKPVNTKEYLHWTTAGVKPEELVFMSGNPGSTARLNTMAQLDFLRETQYPLQLKWRQDSLRALKKFAGESAENARIAQESIFGMENSQKAQKGYYAALLDKNLMAGKARDEQALRAKLTANDPQLESAWTDIANAMQANRQIFVPYMLLEKQQGVDSELATIARQIVRATAEREKPNSERLREFRQSALPSLEQRLFSPAPIYDSLEKLTLTEALGRLETYLPNDAATRRAFGGRTPSQAAEYYIENTKLKDVAYRKKLYEGGWAAVSKSDDPLIALMRDIDQEARDVRKRYDDEVDAVVRREGGRIAQARFKVEGTSFYPDATFTLRLSYGAVRGYTEDGRGSVVPKGTKVAYYTRMGGAFAREQKMGGKNPYALPPSWHTAKAKINLDTPLDFVSTADSIGGNSGSPIVNTKGELVGINFDRNMQGLGRNFYYSEVGMRHIAVDARGIIEALRKIYGADSLANELVGVKKPSVWKNVAAKPQKQK